MIDTTIVRVEAPHFVAAYEYSNTTGTVVRAAPILRWTVGKKVRDVIRVHDEKRYRSDVILTDDAVTV